MNNFNTETTPVVKTVSDFDTVPFKYVQQPDEAVPVDKTTIEVYSSIQSRTRVKFKYSKSRMFSIK